MSPNEINTQDSYNDELLSAYLDGELSADERARVEAYLLENPKARQLLAEFEALSNAIQSLPKKKVNARFHEEVLSAIEKDALKRAARSSQPKEEMGPRLAVEETSPEEKGPARTIPISIGRTARGWIWAAITIAAAILVMLLNSEWMGPNREVAESDGPAGDTAFRDAAGNDIPAEAADSSLTEYEVSPESESIPAREKREESRFLKEAEGLKWDEKTPSVGPLKGPDELAGVPAIDSGLDRGMEAAEPLKTDRPIPETEPESDALLGGLGISNGKVGRGRGGFGRGLPELAKQKKVSQEPLAFKRDIIERNVALQTFFTQNNIQVDQQQPVIVYVDLTPDAARTQVFDTVLGNNSIAYQTDHGATTHPDPSAYGLDHGRTARADSAGKKGYYTPTESKASLADPPEDSLQDPADKRRMAGGEKPKRSELLGGQPSQQRQVAQTEDLSEPPTQSGAIDRSLALDLDGATGETAEGEGRVGDTHSAESEPYEVVLVDVSPAQLHNTLNELNNDSKNYQQLIVLDENIETQHQWNRYDRGQSTVSTPVEKPAANRPQLPLTGRAWRFPVRGDRARLSEERIRSEPDTVHWGFAQSPNGRGSSGRELLRRPAAVPSGGLETQQLVQERSETDDNIWAVFVLRVVPPPDPPAKTEAQAAPANRLPGP
ncbi:MAG: zf-HC2 domain-containing protein [Pirellulales bacterium]|nr:zf-HC2 domain-containing protein [Pirellulales bacterium]